MFLMYLCTYHTYVYIDSVWYVMFTHMHMQRESPKKHKKTGKEIELHISSCEVKIENGKMFHLGMRNE